MLTINSLPTKKLLLQMALKKRNILIYNSIKLLQKQENPSLKPLVNKRITLKISLKKHCR